MNTVRAHLRTVIENAETHRQAALVRVEAARTSPKVAVGNSARGTSALTMA